MMYYQRDVVLIPGQIDKKSMRIRAATLRIYGALLKIVDEIRTARLSSTSEHSEDQVPQC